MKQALKNPNELIVGTRVKLPIAGWWLGSRKKLNGLRELSLKLEKLKKMAKYM